MFAMSIMVAINASFATLLLRRHLKHAAPSAAEVSRERRVPPGIVLVHIALLAATVLLAHHPVAFLGLILMLLGFAQAYEWHQSPLIFKEALLVGVFLAGLVVLGGMQGWWLQPIMSRLEPLASRAVG